MFPYSGHNYAASPDSYQFDVRLNVDFATGHVQVNLPPQAFAKKMSPHQYLSQTMPGHYPQQVYYPTTHFPYNSMHPQQIQQPVFYHRTQQQCASQKSVPTHAESNHFEPVIDRRQSMGELGNSHSTVRNINPIHYAQYHQGVRTIQSSGEDRQLQNQPEPVCAAPQPKQPNSLRSTINGESMQAVQCVICQRLIHRDHFQQHLQEHRRRRLPHRQENQQEVWIRNRNQQAQARDALRHTISSHSRSKLQQALMSDDSMQSGSIRYRQDQSEFCLSNTQSQKIVRQARLTVDQSAGNSMVWGEQARASEHVGCSTHDRPNILAFHKIESVIIRKPRQPIAFEDCGQSVIQSKDHSISRQSSVCYLRNQLRSAKRKTVDESESSIDDISMSLKVFPAQSVKSSSLPAWKLPQSRSNFTQKLSRSKLPVNYLAHSEFIGEGGSLTGSEKKFK